MSRVIFTLIFGVLVSCFSLNAQILSSPVSKNAETDLDYMLDAVELDDRVIFSMYSKKQYSHIITSMNKSTRVHTCLYSSGYRPGASPHLTRLGKYVFFYTRSFSKNHLWYTDGTPEGTRELFYEGSPVTEIANPTRPLWVIHDRIYLQMVLNGAPLTSVYSIDSLLEIRPVGHPISFLGSRGDTLQLSNGEILFWTDLGGGYGIDPDHSIRSLNSFENENTIGSFQDTVIFSNFKRFYYLDRNIGTSNLIPFTPNLLSQHERHLTKVNTHAFEGHIYLSYPDGNNFVFKKVNVVTGEHEDKLLIAGYPQGYPETYSEMRGDTIMFTASISENIYKAYRYIISEDELTEIPVELQRGKLYWYDNYLAYVGIDGHFYGFDLGSNEEFFISQRTLLSEEEYTLVPIKDRIQIGNRLYFNFDVNPRVSAFWEMYPSTSNLAVEITVQGRDKCSSSGGTGYLYPIVRGNSGPYSFQWSGGTTQFSYEHVSVTINGNYRVTVTDSNGQTATNSIAYSSNFTELNSTTTAIASSPDVPSGSLEIKVTSGVSPYKYYWPHDGRTTAIADSLSAGTYLYEVLSTKNFCKLENSGIVPLGTGTNSITDISSLVYPTLLGNQNRVIYLDKLEFIPSEVTLIDNTGRFLKIWRQNYIGNHIDLPILSSGRYHLQIKSDQRLYSAKFIVID